MITNKNLLVAETTPQELFNHCVQHIVSMPRQSRVDGHCVYRSDGGLACAIGACIPDELYKAEWDTYGVGASKLIRAKFPEAEHLMGLAMSLQAAHDDRLYWDADGFNDLGKAHLREIAGFYELTVPAGVPGG